MKQVESKQIMTFKNTLENIDIVHSTTVIGSNKSVVSRISIDGTIAGEATLKEGIFKLYLMKAMPLDKIKAFTNLILNDYQEIETKNYVVQ